MAGIFNKARRSVLVGASAIAAFWGKASSGAAAPLHASASRQQYFHPVSGRPLASGRLYTYAPGSSVPKLTYQDAAHTVPNTNPITLDSTGSAAIHWVGKYRIVLKDASGNTIYTADDYNTDQVTAHSVQPGQPVDASDVSFLQANNGAVKRTLQDKLRETVSVADFGADDSGTASPANTLAFSRAALSGKDISVPKPSVSYYLHSDPNIPNNVSIIASPDWFSGPGKLSMHRFIEISEGVDPRSFAVKGMHFAQTEANESKRKWALAGWVYYGKSPSPAATGLASDAVGVDGRAVVDAFNGRGWGVLGLAHMTNKAYNGIDPGVSQAYAAEFDVNNNTGHDVTAFDTGPVVRGVSVVSGGTNRPAEAFYTLATRTPTNGQGENRFYCGWRVYQDAVYEKGYIIHVDDGNKAAFARIPPGCAIRHTYREGITFVQYQDVKSKRYVLWSQTPGYGVDHINGKGERIYSSNDNGIEMKKPLRRSTVVESAAVSLDASMGDIHLITTGGVISGIINGVDGQRLTLLNASGARITVQADRNMRLAGGSCVLANTDTIELVFAEPTWFEVCRSPNAR